MMFSVGKRLAAIFPYFHGICDFTFNYVFIGAGTQLNSLISNYGNRDFRFNYVYIGAGTRLNLATCDPRPPQSCQLLIPLVSILNKYV